MGLSKDRVPDCFRIVLDPAAILARKREANHLVGPALPADEREFCAQPAHPSPVFQQIRRCAFVGDEHRDEAAAQAGADDLLFVVAACHR